MRIAVLALVAACGTDVPKERGITTYAQAADAAVAGMEEFGEILEGVEDVATAEAAAPRVLALGKKLSALVGAVDRLAGEPPPEVAARVEQAFSALSARTAAYTAVAIETPEVLDVLAEGYGEVQDQIQMLRGRLGG